MGGLDARGRGGAFVLLLFVRKIRLILFEQVKSVQFGIICGMYLF